MDFGGDAIEGVGIGLRSAHIADILKLRPPIPWLEILTDNFLNQGGLNHAHLHAVCEHYPITFHGVGLSLGGVDPFDWDYLRALKHLAQRFKPQWISEHACFSAHNGKHFHDLLPLPYTEEAVEHLALRVTMVQDFLGERILIENVSRYISFTHSHMSEGEFLAAVASKADCYLLLDVNNAYVNAVNHTESCAQFFQHLPLQRVKEVHLAGFENKGSYLLDTHNNPVANAVWIIYQQLLTQLPSVPTLIEWDNDIPALTALLAEREKAARLQDMALEAMVPGHLSQGRPVAQGRQTREIS